MLLQGPCWRSWVYEAAPSSQYCIALSEEFQCTDQFLAAVAGALPTLVRVCSRSEQQVRLASLSVLRELARQDALQTVLVAEGAVALLAALQHSAAPEVRLLRCGASFDRHAAFAEVGGPRERAGALLAALLHSALPEASSKSIFVLCCAVELVTSRGSVVMFSC